MIQYGLISKVDAACIEKTLDLIIEQFKDESIHVTEIGIFDGQTARGIREYLLSKDQTICYTAIDNEKDKPILRPFEACNMIIGNSNEVYNMLDDNSQHLIMVDGNHSFPYVISDYYCYGNKVKNGGYLCFHDASPQAQGKDWQRMGDEKDLDMRISVLKALGNIGLMEWETAETLGWKCLFHEWDKEDMCGGIIVFKKILTEI